MTLRSLLAGAALLAFATPVLSAPARAAAPLVLSGSTDLPGYTGDFDHFAIDEKDKTLFLAGEESAELEAMDVATGKVKTRLKGFGVPHSIHYMAAANELLVIDGGKPSPVLDAATLKIKRSYALPKGADSSGFDAATGEL